MSNERNAPWSRGACAECGTDILLARAEATHGPQTCEACQVYASANADWGKRVAEVVAELRRLSNSEHEKAKVMEPGNSDYHAGIGYGIQDAADLVAEKLGVK